MTNIFLSPFFIYSFLRKDPDMLEEHNRPFISIGCFRLIQQVHPEKYSFISFFLPSIYIGDFERLSK